MLFFLEVQGYFDPSIYWRFVHEIGLYHVQNPELNGREWRAVLLFLDQAHDPGLETLGPLANGVQAWLQKGVLADLLSASSPQSPLLHVLRPLVVSGADEVRQRAGQWAAEIRESKAFTAATQVRLLDMLTLLIVQRFSQMTREEIDNMLQLTPLEQTRAGQELIEQGEVNILSRLIARKFNISQEVATATLRRLRHRDLEALSDYVLEAESFSQIRAWLEQRAHLDNGN